VPTWLDYNFALRAECLGCTAWALKLAGWLHPLDVDDLYHDGLLEKLTCLTKELVCKVRAKRKKLGLPENAERWRVAKH
jgi:hypothetical protein